MMTAGFDPDLHRSALAVVENGRLVAVGIFRVPLKVKGLAATRMMVEVLDGSFRRFFLGAMREVCHVAIEMPELVGRRHARPDDIVRLAVVSGAALAESAGAGVLVSPRWKGNVPKEIHQQRIWQRLGKTAEVAHDYAVPLPDQVADVRGAREIARGEWKHVSDAIGLALWAADQVDCARGGFS